MNVFDRPTSSLGNSSAFFFVPSSTLRDGYATTHCAASRNSMGYIALLANVEAANPSGDIFGLRTIAAVIIVLRPVLGSPSTRASSRFSFPKELGSTCRRAGGGSSDAMRSLDRVLSMPMRSIERCMWLRRNSTGEPNCGSGDDPQNGAPSASPLLLPPLRNRAAEASGLGCLIA
jgi:hypothetical protein